MKKNKAKLPTFVSSDRMKARGAAAHLLETFVNNYIEPSLRYKARKRKLRDISIGTEYLFNFFEIIRHEERVRAIALICSACKKNIDLKPHGDRFIHEGDHGICKAWRIRNFINNDIRKRSERMIRRMAKSKVGHNLPNLTSRLKKYKIV